MTKDAPTIETVVYRAKSPAGIKPILCLFGTLLGFGLGAILFMFLLLFRIGNGGEFKAMSILLPPIFFGVACLSYGLVLILSPQEVKISPGGIEIETPIRTRTIPWTEIVRIEQDKTMVLMTAQTYRKIVLFGQGGRRLASISELVANFDDLTSRVDAIVRARSDHKMTSGLMRRSKRNGIIFVSLGIACFIAYPFLIVEQLKMRRGWQQLEAAGVDVSANVDRLYMHNNIAPRVEYSFKDNNGERHTRNTLILGQTWDRLSVGRPVPIRYLRDDPEFNRIMDGEEDAGSEKGIERIVIGILGATLMGGLFTGGGIMQLMGIDITFDEKKRRFRIKRLDEPAEAAVDTTVVHVP